MRTSDKSNQERTQLRPPPYGLCAPGGLWIRVRARIRRLQEGEWPEGLELVDDRMVEFGGEHQGLLIEDWTELYQPLQHPELWPEFVRVFAGDTPPSAPEVIRFYAHYGPLRVMEDAKERPQPAWVCRLSRQARRQLSPEASQGLCEPLWWLREKAQEVKLTYELYAALCQGRLEELVARLGPVPKGSRITRVGIAQGRLVRWATEEEPGARQSRRRAGSVALPEPLPPQLPAKVACRALAPEEARTLVLELLAAQLNQGEERSYRRWAVYQPLPLGDRRTEPWGEPSPTSLELVRDQYFHDLVAAMYLQLGEVVSQRSLLRVCPGCRRLFYPGRRDQLYCSKHCGDATRQRLYYRNPQVREQRPAAGKRSTRRSPRRRRT